MPLGRGISGAWFPSGCRQAADSVVRADAGALPGSRAGQGLGWRHRRAPPATRRAAGAV